MANPFVHVELETTNLEPARIFCASLLAWQPRDLPMPPGSDTMLVVGEGAGATRVLATGSDHG